MRRLVKRFILFLLLTDFITLYPCVIAMGQGLDVHRIGHEALDQEAYTAATYFLYADYLRNPREFSDYEITAFLLAEMGEYSKADSLLQRVTEIGRIKELPDSLRYFYYASRAKINHYNNENIEALNCIAQVQSGAELTDLKARCLTDLGLFDQAIKVYSSLYDAYGEDYINCQIGECYRKKGDYSKAIEFFTLAKQVNPDRAFPYYGIGWSYELSGDEDLALRYYDEGLKVDPSDAYIFFKRGELYDKKGDREKAENDFKTVLRLDKTIKDGTCRQYALFFLGRNDDALNWMNRVIEYEPNTPGHYYDKACLCCRMGLNEEAVIAIRTAFEKGFRQFALLDADDDISTIKNNPEYIALYNKYYDVYMGELDCLKSISFQDNSLNE